MFRYLFTLALLLILAACSPAGTENVAELQEESEETAASHEEASEEEDHASQDEEDHGEEHEGEHDDEHASSADGHDEEEHDERREHGAHEHGIAALTVAWSGSELAIDLYTPAYNILGFEYAPTSDEEQGLLEESVSALEAGDLLQFNAEAGCTLVSAAVETELEKEEHDEDEDAHEEDEEVHSDIDVAYNFQCQNPDQLTQLDVTQLFERFPNFEDLDVQWVSDTQQSAAELTPENSVLSFE